MLSLKSLGNLLLRAALCLIYIVWLFNLYIFCMYCKLLWNISALRISKPQAFYIWLLPVTICNNFCCCCCLILQVQNLGWYRKVFLTSIYLALLTIFFWFISLMVLKACFFSIEDFLNPRLLLVSWLRKNARNNDSVMIIYLMCSGIGDKILLNKVSCF